MPKKTKEHISKTMVNEPLEAYGQPLSFEKVWLMFQETDQKFKETDKKIKELSDLFTSQWGRLVESLVEGSVIKIFREVGINVHYTQERVKGSAGRENFEFDIMAFNNNEMVVIEVKTTLRPQDVKTFVAKLKKLKKWMPRFSEYKMSAAMAFLKANSGAETQAEKAGLYIIKATGDSAHLINSDQFIAKAF